MTVSAVGRALKRLGAATTAQLAAELGGSAREVETLLAFWEHRGNARECSTIAGGGCGTSCKACAIGRRKPGSGESGSSIRAYEWVESRSPAHV